MDWIDHIVIDGVLNDVLFGLAASSTGLTQAVVSSKTR